MKILFLLACLSILFPITNCFGQKRSHQPDLVPELLKGIKKADVFIRVDVTGASKDPGKAKVVKGLQNARDFTPAAKALLIEALKNYPIIRDPYSMDFEYPEICDFVGSFLIDTKDGFSWSIQFGAGNFVQLEKMQRVKDKNQSVVSQAGIWLSGELTIYRICELMQK